VFVLPSTNQETWGLVVNEAMLFGMPAIVSNQVGSAQDLVIEGETGWTFEGGAIDLARAMHVAIENRSQLKSMGAAACERVAEGYSMDIASASFIRAIEFVAQRKLSI
ncbi:MAG: glycosyltransferase, partial [Casimicrobium sp.]